MALLLWARHLACIYFTFYLKGQTHIAGLGGSPVYVLVCLYMILFKAHAPKRFMGIEGRVS
jgi:hypothetical protein